MSADGSAERSLRIFVNYRHEDTQPTAWMLYTKLKDHFGPGNVFFDQGTLRPGMRWFDEIKSHLAADAIFLALIGRRWVSVMNTNLQRGGDDYVVKEIGLAFRAGQRVTVIPVLADDAELPAADELPLLSLRALLDCQTARLRPAHLPDDIDHLIATLDEIRNRPAAVPPELQAAAPPGTGPALRPRRAEPTRVAPRPDEEHYRMVARQAGNLVVFLGADANADERAVPWSAGSGMLPNDRDLATYLASHAELNDASPHLAEVAQYAYAIYGEQTLFDWVTQALQVDPEPGPVQQDPAPSSVHEYLAHLPALLGNRFQMIVTPKYDAALEKAFKQAGQDFDVAVYMAPGTEEKGKFVHLPCGEWDSPQPIDKPNEYHEFPIVAGDSRLRRTVIVRINGAIVDESAGFPWEYNCVLTEDHYIDYMSGRSAEEVVPTQILAKLKKSNYLFLGYSISDWRLRVFLQRIRKGRRLGHAKHWAVEYEPDALAKDLWTGLDVQLYQSSLTDYLQGLYDFLEHPPEEVQP